jgi:hypothetical protein
MNGSLRQREPRTVRVAYRRLPSPGGDRNAANHLAELLERSAS